MLLPFIALLSCAWPPYTPFEGTKRTATEHFSDPGLADAGSAHVVQLWRSPADFKLPDSTLGPDFAGKSSFPVELRVFNERKNGKVYESESPFREDLDGRKSAPSGMAVEVDGEELRYHPQLIGKSWALRSGKILFFWPEAAGVLEPEKVRIRYTGVSQILERRDPLSSGLPTDEFVQYEVSLETRTRRGLLLPAPAVATWSLELPADRSATFDTVVAMAPSPLKGLESDGATAIVQVSTSAHPEPVELGRQRVPAEGAAFVPFRVDLSAYAGQAVKLSLVSDPGANNHLDHVFYGAPTVWSGPVEPPRRVVVIGLDTTRPQNFGVYGYPRATTPELDDIASHAIIFDNAWTPAPRTRPSFRSATTGRRPLDAVGATNIGEVFSNHGFATAGIVANIHLQPRFDFHKGFDDWWFDGHAQASDQVDRGLAFLNDYRERDTYLFLHIMDPHMIYGAPGSYRDMFVENPDPTLPRVFTRSEVYKWMDEGPISDQRKVHVQALYDGELRYTSHELARFFEQLDRLEGRTLVVVHNDHGEEFWQHGQFEHNHSLYDDTTRGLLWFRAGAGQQTGRRIEAPVSLPDIAPTLYDFAGFSDTPPTDGRSLKGLIEGTEDAAAWSERAIGTAHLRYGLDRWGVVFQNHKYILHTASGAEELYDLSNDPAEASDLSRAVDLAPFQQQLGPAHGMRAGKGWRVRIELPPPKPGDSPFVLQLPRAATWAGVVPPSMTIPDPKNQAWGEKPRRLPSEVGTTTLSADGLTLTFEPGSNPTKGLLFVLFEADVSPTDATMMRGDEALPLLRSTVWTWSEAESYIRIEPGMVFEVLPSEAERMRAASGEASAEEVQRLCALGYLEGEICGDAEGGEHDHGDGG